MVFKSDMLLSTVAVEYESDINSFFADNNPSFRDVITVGVKYTTARRIIMFFTIGGFFSLNIKYVPRTAKVNVIPAIIKTEKLDTKVLYACDPVKLSVL